MYPYSHAETIQDSQEMQNPRERQAIIGEATQLSFAEFFNTYYFKSPCRFNYIMFMCKGAISICVNDTASQIMLSDPNDIYITAGGGIKGGIFLSGNIVDYVIVFSE